MTSSAEQPRLSPERGPVCLILSGGAFCPIPEELRAAAYVIACDRGWEYARALELKPNLILGDFDSAPRPDDPCVPVLQVPTRKDDTDTMLAVRQALERGFRNLALCCALGGRFDHSFANVQSAAFAVSCGAQVRLLGQETDIWVFSEAALTLPRRSGWSLSLFALSDRCEGVSVRGCKYACENVVLTNRFPLGVSNCWDSARAEIHCGGGILMVVLSKLKQGEHI